MGNWNSDMNEPRIAKEEAAPHLVVIQYCGGWGYESKVKETISRMNKNFPGKFRY